VAPPRFCFLRRVSCLRVLYLVLLYVFAIYNMLLKNIRLFRFLIL
jgi:hypothetical protein